MALVVSLAELLSSLDASLQLGMEFLQLGGTLQGGVRKLWMPHPGPLTAPQLPIFPMRQHPSLQGRQETASAPGSLLWVLCPGNSTKYRG